MHLKARVTRRRSLVLDKQKRFQLSSELAETVRWPQWSRQLVPKPRSCDIKVNDLQVFNACGLFHTWRHWPIEIDLSRVYRPWRNRNFGDLRMLEIVCVIRVAFSYDKERLRHRWCRLSVYPSVCPSVISRYTIWRRLYVGSHSFHRPVAQGL